MEGSVIQIFPILEDKSLYIMQPQGDIGLVNLLLHHGADLNIVDEEGQSAFHVAAASGYASVVLILLKLIEDRLSKHEAPPSPTNTDAAEPQGKSDVESEFNINAEDYKNNTALHLAAMAPQTRVEKILQVLLENGADPNRVNWFGYTPLHLFCAHHDGPVTVVDMFIEHGTDITSQSLDGSTPLHLSVGKASKAISIALVRAGAPVYVQDVAGRSVVNLAESTSQGVMVVPLLLNVNTPPPWMDLEWQHENIIAVIVGGLFVASVRQIGFHCRSLTSPPLLEGNKNGFPDETPSAPQNGKTLQPHGLIAELPPRQDKLWEAIVLAHEQNNQLSDAIERNALKLVDYILEIDKASSSNLAHLSAPIASTLRELFKRKNHLEKSTLEDIKRLGPPLIVELGGTVENWISNSQLQTLLESRTASLQDEIKQAHHKIEVLEIKLNAYKAQLQQTTTLGSAPTSQSSHHDSTPAKSISSPSTTLSPKEDTRLQEKDALIAALKETLDEVARESSRMEKLIVTQMDTIAELKQAAVSSQASLSATTIADQNTDSQQSEGGIEETIPEDDGHVHKIEDFETPLPPGWEMRVTNSGNVYFVHAKSKVTTWVDPRTHPIQVAEAISNTTTFIPAPSTHYSIEFHDKRRIGILFQPNTPLDHGAAVRRVLNETPAALAKQIQPGHQLVAVNGHQIQDASFKHVMLLLQGGFRPLTLTFDRVVRENADTNANEKQQVSPQEYSLADKIITSVFSMMWSLPEEPVEHI
ncbi:unnamed protein product [Aphanomyces euteiches]